MDTSNTSVSTTENQSSKNNTKNLIIGLLIAGILIMGGFLIFNNNRNGQTLQTQQTEIAKVTSEKSEIQNSFDASLARLDSMTTMNADMQAKLADKDGEIAKVKSEIRSILNKRNATSAELSRARKLIAQLNGQITDLQQQVAMLTLENDSLKTERTVLIANNATLTRNLDSTNVIKTNLEKTVDIASTLNASNISITPVKVKNNGKEKVKTTAKRVDKLVVSFDVNNRIIQPGTTDLYVVVIGPDGQPVTSAQGAGTFTTRDQGDKSFTAKLPVDLETAKTKNVQFGFAPGNHFQQGNYKIEIYQNGFLIGQGSRELKKGGLFG
jgi:peptidoglycan hydrolase CwlO-like protein